MPRYNPNTGQLETYQAGPYDSPHLYLQWGGKLPGAEQWSCGLRFTGPAADVETAPATMLVAVSSAVVAFHQRAGSKISASAKLSFVKLNPIGTNGHYIGDGTTQALYADLPGADAASAPYPNQIAQAVTFTTGFSRGPAHKGRIYLPMPTSVTGATGVVSTSDADAVSDSVDTFRAALNAANADWDLAVFSRKAGAPTHRVITGSEVGRVLDTQRRRRRSLVEDYQ